MVLDARLKKLAGGLSAAETVQNHSLSLLPGEALNDQQKSQAEEFKATVEAMFLMAAVDGVISEEELAQLTASIQAIIDMHAVRGMEVDSALRELHEKLERDGWRARLESVAARIRSAEGRAFAFKLAGGVAFVDDHVAHAEAAAIDALAAALGFSSEESQAILREVADELFGTG
jgi:hypothetical protein